MKYNKEDVLLQTTKTAFIDRVEHRKLFWDTYHKFKINIKSNIINEIKVIMYYGIGGIGKTSLLKEIRNELDNYSFEKKSKVNCVSFDFKDNQNPRTVLTNLRNQLQIKYKYEFPYFDLALYGYSRGIGENFHGNEIKNLMESSTVFSSLVTAGDITPGMNFVSTILKVWDYCTTHQRRKKELDRVKAFELANKEPGDLLNQLPYYFALDFKDNLESSVEPLVIFFDTYEALVNELISIGSPLVNDLWLRDKKFGLITNVPNVIWVIAGRDRLKWDLINKEWKESIHQQVLGDLSKADTFELLESAKITDVWIKEHIYEITCGTPIYLDLCVEQYHFLVRNNQTPSKANLGNNKNELIERFIRYMDDTKKDLVFMLSCLEEWNNELIIDLINETKMKISHYSVENIKNFSFVITENQITYKLHRAVKEVLFDTCPISIKQMVNRYMVTHFKQELDRTLPTNPLYGEIFKKYVTCSLDDNLNNDIFNDWFTLIDTYKEHLLTTFQYEILSSIYESITTYCINKFGDSVNTANSYYELAKIHNTAGYYKEAIVYGEKALSYYENEDPVSRETIVIKVNLASYYIGSGDFKLATKMLISILEISKEILGENDLNTISASINLTSCYINLGLFKEALELSKKTFEITEKALGREHKHTIVAMNNLAKAHSDFGHYQDALTLFINAYETCKKVHGEEHTNTNMAMNNLAFCYRDLGKEQEAFDLLETALRLNNKTIGENHPNTLTVMNNLSVMYGHFGRFDEALELSEKTYKIQYETLGENHPDTIATLYNFALHNIEIGKYNLALEILDKVKHQQIEVLGVEHPNIIFTLVLVVNCYNYIGKYTKALNLAKDLMTKVTKIFEENHPHTMLVMGTLADVYQNLGKYHDAILLNKKIYHFNIDFYGEDHKEAIDSIKKLYANYLEVGLFKEASKLAEHLYEFNLKNFGEYDEKTLASINHVSVCLMHLGRYAKAIMLLKRVVQLANDQSNEYHENTIDSLYNLLTCYTKIKNTKEATNVAEKLYCIHIKLEGMDSENTISIMEKLADNYKKLGRHVEAFDLMNKVKQYRFKHIEAHQSNSNMNYVKR
jgi:tetratricopeptide (TPR) repeat protein